MLRLEINMTIELFPTVWHLIATLFAGVGGVLTAGIWIGKVNTDRSSFKEFMSQVQQDLNQNRQDMNQFRRDMNQFRQDMNQFRQDMIQFRGDLTEIREKLYSILERLPSPPGLAPGSPMRLTNFGKKVSDSLSIGEWAADHAELLKNDASGKPEFEVFEMCVEHVSGQFDEDLKFQRTIREGAYEQSMDVENVKKICEVELRDALLACVNS